MSVIVKIQTQNYSGKTANITFFPDTGGTIDVGSHVVPYDYYAEYYYGNFELYFPEYGDTCFFTVPNPITPTTTTTTTIIPPESIVRGLYLNDLNTIVGNSIEENTLFDWILGWGFNQVYCYDLSNILSTTNGKNNMKSFNTTIRTYGIEKIAGIGGSSNRLIGNVSNSRVTYNNECLNESEKFDILNLENEFWNYNGTSPYINPGTNLQLRWDNGTSDDWKSENELIYSYGQTNNIPTDFYIGILRDGKNSPPTPPLNEKVSPILIVENLVNNTTRVLMDCYPTTDEFTASTDAGFLKIVDRLSMIGTASTANSKVTDVVVLFNGKDEFMKSYFVNNTFDSAYYTVLNSFENSTFIGKEGVNLIGYMIYGYQQVKDIPPIIPTIALGREFAPDIRDRNYLIKDKLTIRPSTLKVRYWQDNEWWGDQGNTPQCVGYSWAHWIEDGPITHGGIAPIVHPTLIYREAQKIDEWPGENYDGTSVRAGAKYLQQTGRIKSYLWAYDLNTLINTVLNVGPVVVGTYWYLRMFYPDRNGLIRIGGPIVGGHAYVINGVDVNKKLFRIKNSWGRRWGANGSAYISFNDMNTLIKMGGEICLATENRF